MVATVPTTRVETLYARAGDAPAALVAALLLAGAARAALRGRPAVTR
jgi:apolipoprotein N-acyltransferase